MGWTATAQLDGEAAPAGLAANDNVVSGGRVAWYRNLHRYYDPAVGRYTQVDPLVRTPWSGHPYAYARSSPVVFSDRRGLWFDFRATEAQAAIESLMNDPFIGEWVVALSDDPNHIVVEPVPGDKISAGGAESYWNPSRESWIHYNLCRLQFAPQWSGLSYPLPVAFAHELGHGVACLFGGNCGYNDPFSNQLSVEFENAVRREQPYRKGHDPNQEDLLACFTGKFCP